ncbi:hypothetical protein HPB47_015110 [Ixodes persulcatus]|uniref:Uncharacterized protein n=1 Tax=Ixodes persulcatus TaxID=34615 RepID=A0AC60QUC4_IXOPE|nr:hypothetical protein HPB47_015110 [Ixodes persulcatus]
MPDAAATTCASSSKLSHSAVRFEELKASVSDCDYELIDIDLLSCTVAESWVLGSGWMLDMCASAWEWVPLVPLLAATAVLVWYTLRAPDRSRLPPGPKGVPLLGYIPFLGMNLHLKFAELAKVYGPIVRTTASQVRPREPWTAATPYRKEQQLARIKEDYVENSHLLETIQSNKVAANRALSQNKKLKRQLEEIRDVFDMLELTKQLQKEQLRPRDWEDGGRRTLCARQPAWRTRPPMGHHARPAAPTGPAARVLPAAPSTP